MAQHLKSASPTQAASCAALSVLLGTRGELVLGFVQQLSCTELFLVS